MNFYEGINEIYFWLYIRLATEFPPFFILEFIAFLDYGV